MSNITLKNGMLSETARHYGLDLTLVNEWVSKHRCTIDRALNTDFPPNAPSLLEGDLLDISSRKRTVGNKDCRAHLKGGRGLSLVDVESEYGSRIAGF